jgi:IS605 OrfB family transposase
VIENLDFAKARADGREHHGNRPVRGKRGHGFRRAISGMPTARLRDRLVQMAANVGLSVIVIDPAYTSRWGVEHWLRPLRQHDPKATGHHAAALVIGRRGLGYRARRRVTGNQTRPSGGGTASPDAAQDHPGDPRPHQEPRHPTRPPAIARQKTARPHRTTAGNQAAHNRSGPPATGPRPASSIETVAWARHE